MAFGNDAFGSVFGEADSVAQHLYDYAMEDAPGSVSADIGARLVARPGNRLESASPSMR
jgi:hypothetical protein